MKAKLAQIVVALTLVCAIGGHWALLQSVAWMGMLVNYTHNSSFVEAVEKTFDGKHPCAICKAVKEGKKCEQSQTLVKLETKIDFWLAVGPGKIYLNATFAIIPSLLPSAPVRNESPPTPPPRLA